MTKKIRHVLGISGGKDSAALAIYLKQQDKIPDMEYFFCDTGVELPEVYTFLDKLEVYLGKSIKRIGNEVNFFQHLKKHDNMLPLATRRWCTKDMKLDPLEKFIGNDEAITYVGIRSDEFREGYLSNNGNIKSVYPFIEDGLIREDIFNILRETVGIPEYYEWRSRSGCFFCFFQRHEEWIGLHDRHPKLFKKAVEMEKQANKDFKDLKNRFSWVRDISLEELLEKRDEVLAKSKKRKEQIANKKDTRSWQDILIEDGQDDEDQACLICSL
jgi:hypothetical protein